MSSRAILISSALLAALVSGSAHARSGGSSNGDSYENDMMRNPRLIEPGGEAGRYLSYYPRQGYDQRRAAEAERSGYGYPRNIRVRPYGY